MKNWLLALITAGCLMSLALPAQADPIIHSDYEHFVVLRYKEKSLLPPVQVPNAYAAHILDFHRTLRPFSSGMMAKAIDAVDFSFLPAQFGTDVLIRRDQANALVQLGILSHMGHFAVINSSNVEVRKGAVAIINQLADIADHFKLGSLQSQYQRLASDVADPSFNGGPSALTGRYDATVATLYDFVANSYGVDGHWYFMEGGAVASAYATALGGDRLNVEYPLLVLNDLYHFRPRLRADYASRVDVQWLVMEPRHDTQFIAQVAWDLMSNYMGHTVWTNARGHADNFTNAEQVEVKDRKSVYDAGDRIRYGTQGGQVFFPTEVPEMRDQGDI